MMEYGSLPGVDLMVSRFVQGATMLTSEDLAYSFKVLDDAFEAGCNAFDTAHIYGQGDCERVLGQWIADRGVRDKVVVITKGAHHNADRKRVTSFDITSDLHDSLARLKTEYIDLYLLHRDDPDMPAGPIVEILHQHAENGKIRLFGGSNWTCERIQAANAYAEEHGLRPFAVTSPQYSLVEMVEEPWPDCVSLTGPAGAEHRRWCADTQFPVFAWSSLAGGFLSGRHTPETVEAAPAGEDSEEELELCIRCYRSQDNIDRLRRAHDIARKHDATVPQVALAWLFRQGLNVFALVGAANPGELKHNVQAFQLDLSSEELAYLNLEKEEA